MKLFAVRSASACASRFLPIPAVQSNCPLVPGLSADDAECRKNPIVSLTEPDISRPLIHNAEPEDVNETSRHIVFITISFRYRSSGRFKTHGGRCRTVHEPG